MMIVRRTCKALLGFALGVGFGAVIALVMPLAMAGEAWREGDAE